MRFNKLDLNLLVALDVLLEERSVTRAAHRLHLSQSATSGVLARLREYFNDELLVQVGKAMVTTALAAELAAPVQAILGRIQSTIEMRSGFEPETAVRTFRIVASDYSVNVLLTDVVRTLSRAAPGVSLEIINPGPAALERAERGEVDLVFMPDRYTALSGACAEPLFSDVYCCIAWSGNRQLGQDDALTMDRYLALGHVVARFGEREVSPEEVHCSGLRQLRRVEITTGMFSLLPQLVVGTDRIATLHRRLAEQAARYLPVRLFPPPLDMPALTIMMKWSRHLDADAGHRWLRETLKAAVAQQGKVTQGG